MDRLPSKSDFDKHARFSKSNVNTYDIEHSYETGDSAVMNQSVIISGNLTNVNCEIHDISNICSTSDDLNTNIDALMPDKKAIFLEDQNHIDTLNGKPLKNHCMGGHDIPIACNKSDLYKSKKLDILEAPEVEITSREESNGKFLVKFHIKSFGKI